MKPLVPPAVLLRPRFGLASTFLALVAGFAMNFALPYAALAGKRPIFQIPYDRIESVDIAQRTIVLSHVNSKDTSSKTYRASDACEIEVNGAKAAFDSLKPGLKVSVTQSSEGVASRIVAGAPPVQPTPPPKK